MTRFLWKLRTLTFGLSLTVLKQTEKVESGAHWLYFSIVNSVTSEVLVLVVKLLHLEPVLCGMLLISALLSGFSDCFCLHFGSATRVCLGEGFCFLLKSATFISAL